MYVREQKKIALMEIAVPSTLVIHRVVNVPILLQITAVEMEYARPMKLVAAYTRINAAKRRGSSSPDAITTQTQVVALNIPSVVINQHTSQNIQVNINNQVIKAGNQDLVTVQSANMESLVAKSKSLASMSKLAHTVLRPPNEVQHVP